MRAKIYYVIILLLAFGLLFWTNIKISFLFMAIFVLIVPLSILINFIVARFVEVKVDVSQGKSTGEGQLIDYRLLIKNKSVFPVFMLRVGGQLDNYLTDTLIELPYQGSVAPFGKKERHYKIISKYCGRVEGNVSEAYVSDFLGLSKFKVRIKTKGLVYVYPDADKSEIGDIISLIGDELEVNEKYLRRKGNDITEILDIRGYQKGDPIKNIHWKLTARMGEKMVRELDMPTNQDIILFFSLSEEAGKDPKHRVNVVTKVMAIIDELIKEQMNLDAVIFSENQNLLGLYSIEGEETMEWYEHSLLDGDVSFDTATVDRYIYGKNVLGKYSSVIFVSDEEAGVGPEADNVIRILA